MNDNNAIFFLVDQRKHASTFKRCIENDKQLVFELLFCGLFKKLLINFIAINLYFRLFK